MSGFDFVTIYRCPGLENADAIKPIPNGGVEVYRGPKALKLIDVPNTIQALERGKADPVLMDVVIGDANPHLLLKVTVPNGDPLGMAAAMARLDRLAATIAVIYGHSLFYEEVFRGGIFNGVKGSIQLLAKPTPNKNIDINNLPHRLELAEKKLGDGTNLGRLFDLAAGFFCRSLTANTENERIVHLWTSLEIYPMRGSRSLFDLDKALAAILKTDAKTVSSLIKTGPLYGLRGELLHRGELSEKNQKDSVVLTSKLHNIVVSVLRDACGLPYDGVLDEYITVTK